MSRVARYGKAVARNGRGAELAELLLAVAADLDADPGCELYLINRQSGEPDVIGVTELWRSQDDLDASIERIRGSDEVASGDGARRGLEDDRARAVGGKGTAPPFSERR